MARSYNFFPVTNVYYAKPNNNYWKIRSVDTMKYSRDLSREKLNDITFDAIIDEQVGNISGTGATHVAIATPYDEEFFPILKRWVDAARKYKLNVWFRGNFSGWEKWFDYPAIGREEHKTKTEKFIISHPDIFEDGDVFSSCPECENGGPGDPRLTGDVKGFRSFIIEEYRETKSAFSKIGRKVQSNLFSMNGDVARLVMDAPTTGALDGIVTIDHYVGTSDRLLQDIKNIANESGGKIVLGEFGAPIPDIHGDLTEDEQAEWIDEALHKLRDANELEGINYWSAVGGSTAIWRDDGGKKKAVDVLNKYFSPKTAYGIVRDELGRPIPDALITYLEKEAYSDENGYFEFSYFEDAEVSAKISASGYNEKEIPPHLFNRQIDVSLKKRTEDPGFMLAKFLRIYLLRRSSQ